MKNTVFFGLVAVSLVIAKEEQESPENGWIPYKNELQIKAFNTVLTYDDAKNFCSGQGDKNARGSLLMIKEACLQNFVANYTHDIADNIWLGSKYDSESSTFKWEDGDPLTYTNWANGYPRNVTNAQTCLELLPDYDRSSQYVGKWIHVTCRKRNLVLCQKSIPWTLEDAVKQIIKIRKDLQAEVTRREDAEQILNDISAAIVPVGSIYVEYYNQTSPQILWRMFRWQDITSVYAGHFFRASGGGSETWGVTQTECAPRIVGMELQHRQSPELPNPLVIPPNGWSEFGFAGAYFTSGTRWLEGLRFNTSGCEVRPKNQAIRIWKRIA